MELWELFLVVGLGFPYIILGLFVLRHSYYVLLKRGDRTLEMKWLSRRPRRVAYALLFATFPVVLGAVVVWLLLQVAAYTAYGVGKVLGFVVRTWRSWAPVSPVFVLVALVGGALLVGGSAGEVLMAIGFALTLLFATLGVAVTMRFIKLKVAKK